ncbi:hypothetical protein RB12814 [Rhodopirellula baltica SH 1]|uniref:Uncharacterized protein n=1 Tax=Rhodopirellula baltica (strain DSM 10527 / NCIMB 13988 / SH1) TaxID=243090 RepID=Q7UI18_RHOBA|nr:hypothetical protein RB12814 [Rhodopirellula baltica SH 1]
MKQAGRFASRTFPMRDVISGAATVSRLMCGRLEVEFHITKQERYIVKSRPGHTTGSASKGLFC